MQYRYRRERLIEKCQNRGADGFVSGSLPDIRYYTGCLDIGGVLIGSESGFELITSAHDAPQAAGEIQDIEIVEWRPGDDPVPVLNDRILALGLRHVIVSQLELPVYQALAGSSQQAHFAVVPDLTRELRRTKDADELISIRRAVRIAELGMAAARATLRPGVRERDVAVEAGAVMRRNGGDGFAFEMKIERGERSAWPSCYASDRVIQAGDLVLIDLGPTCRGYFGDLTRTFVIGEPDRRRRDLLEKVLEAQTAALDTLRAGVTGHTVDAAARTLLADTRGGGRFLHHTGHTLGLTGDAFGIFAPNQITTLLAGECATVEPGMYLPEIGGVRIEDDVLITPDGFEFLTSFPRSLESLIVA